MINVWSDSMMTVCIPIIYEVSDNIRKHRFNDFNVDLELMNRCKIVLRHYCERFIFLKSLDIYMPIKADADHIKLLLMIGRNR